MTNNTIDINNARTILNKLIVFTDCGRFPSVLELPECDIVLYDLQKYFGTLNEAVDVMLLYYEEPTLDLEFVCEHKVTFLVTQNENGKQYHIKNPEVRAKAIRKSQSRRRGFGTPTIINKKFKGSHMHHMHVKDNPTLCVYIPKELHTSIPHAWNKPESMFEINTAAMEFLATQEMI